MKLVCRICGALLILSMLGSAAAEESHSAQLAELERQVSEQTIELTAVRAKQSALETELRSNRSTAQKLENEKRSLQVQLQTNRQQQAAVEARIEELRVEYSKLEDLSQKRVRALYQARSSGGMERIVFSSHAQYTGRYAYFLKIVRNFDMHLLGEMAELRSQKVIQANELSRIVADQSRFEIEYEDRRRALEAKIVDQQKLVKSVKDQRSRIEGVLAELRSQALRLETVVQSLTSDAESLKAITLNKAQERPSTADEQPQASFVGAGLRAAIKSLVLPVHGKVVSTFGRSKAAGFEDFVFNKGVEFSSQFGESVLAIASGRVLFLGSMPGYGTLLILDHGERSYSLYGRLASLDVKKGDIVEKGQKIAQLGGTLDQEGKNFYFEIRENGKPVDPKRYFPKL